MIDLERLLEAKFLDKYSRSILWLIYTRIITRVDVREYDLSYIDYINHIIYIFDRAIRVQLECCAIGICIESTILRTWPWRCQEKAARKGRPWTCLPCDPRLLIYTDDRYLCTSFRRETVNIESSFLTLIFSLLRSYCSSSTFICCVFTLYSFNHLQ